MSLLLLFTGSVGVTAVFSDFGGPVEWGLIEQNNVLLPSELDAVVLRDRAGLLEFAIASQGDRLTPIELNLAVLFDRFTPIELSVAARTDVVVPYDLGSTISSEVMWLAEVNLLISEDQAQPAENGLVARDDHVTLIDLGLLTVFDIAAPVSWASSMIVDGGQFLADAGAITVMDGSDAVENLLTFLIDDSAAIELGIAVRDDTPVMRLEMASATRVDPDTQAETALTALVGELTPFEWVAGTSAVFGDQTVAIETALRAVISDAWPVEVLGTASYVSDMPGAWRGIAERDIVLEQETAKLVLADVLMPVDWLIEVAVTVDSFVPVEVAASRLVDQQLSQTLVSLTSADALTWIDWSAPLSVTSAEMPIEFRPLYPLLPETGYTIRVLAEIYALIAPHRPPPVARDQGLPTALVPPELTAVRLVPPVSYVDIVRGSMPYARTLPSVLPNQEQTVAIDFGEALPAGVTLTGMPIVTISLASGNDPNPQSRLLRAGAVGTAPKAIGGTGVTNAAVLFQVGTCVPGAIYIVDVVCARTDSDVAESSTRLSCIPPA